MKNSSVMEEKLKVYVVGVVGHGLALVSSIESALHTKDFVIVNVDNIREVPVDSNVVVIDENAPPAPIPFLIQNIPQLDMPFYPSGKERSRFKRNQKWGGKNR